MCFLSGPLHWAIDHHVVHNTVSTAVYHYIVWMTPHSLNRSPYAGHLGAAGMLCSALLH